MLPRESARLVRTAGTIFSVTLAAFGLLPLQTRAECNVIPAAMTSFRAALGSTNRPFAGPGDVVELSVRPKVCDTKSSGYVDLDGDGSRSDDLVVTVLFVPPNGGARNAVVLAESCQGIDVAACGAKLGLGGSAQCVLVNAAPTGPKTDLVVPDLNRLQFRFPDTDARLGALDDDRTLAGPAKIVVTRRGAPPACQLATSRCADLAGTTTPGVLACVDELFEPDGTCRSGTAHIAQGFGHFVALPPPNDLQKMIQSPESTEARLTTDKAGNVLLPMDYTGLLLRVNGRPVPILTRGGTSLAAFLGSGAKIEIPAPGFIGSYSPEGVVLPPFFTPLSDPSDPATLFGSVDAPRGVIRIARQACVGGEHDGRSCASSAQCEDGGVCSAPIFDLSNRYASGVGPILLAPGQYTANRDTPITLESVTQLQASGSFAFVTYEGFDGVDRNGDEDASDFVVTLRDPVSGKLLPIGPSGTAGRAVVQSHTGAFIRPALETSGDLVAFLESEPGQDSQDTNGNYDVFDSILRIFLVGSSAAAEITSAPLTGEAALAFAGRFGAWLGRERFFFRTPEAREAEQITKRVSVDRRGIQGNAGSSSPSMSADGRFVAFGSSASNLVFGDTNGAFDVFVYDRATGATERVSVDSAGSQANSPSYDPSISSDGRFVAFYSDASNLVPDDTNGAFDVFVYDRATGAMERVNVDSAGSQANAESINPSISSDGRFVAFYSQASNLVPGDTNGQPDVFVHDRVTGVTERVSVDSVGNQANGYSYDESISADGRFVAFRSDASNLVPGDTNGRFDVFVHDRVTGVTERVSVDSVGNQENGYSYDESISADGRFVAFASGASNLVPGDTNGQPDVFVHDRLTGATERVNVDSAGSQANGQSYSPSIGSDGRFVAFRSLASNLVSGDTNVTYDIFVHDRLTGATKRVSVDSAGSQASGSSDRASMSADGRFVAFSSNASNLVSGDTNGTTDVFVHGALGGFEGPPDRSGDGDLDDTVLRVAHDSSGGFGMVDDICPADEAVAAGSLVAFLRPEAAGPSVTGYCWEPSADRNGDGDTQDHVVELYDGASVKNLRCAATDLALSTTRLAVLVSEAEEEEEFGGSEEFDERILFVRSASAAAPPSSARCNDPGTGWTNTRQPGDAIGISGDVVTLLAPGTGAQRVIRLVNGATGQMIPLLSDTHGSAPAPPIPSPAREFVQGSSLVAFRMSEADAGKDLNGDHDLADNVLQVLVVQDITTSSGLETLATGLLVNTGQAVTPCTLPECDASKPYRVSADTVRFLTLESEQGRDLNQDGDLQDLVVQVFNIQSRQSKVVAVVSPPSATSVPGTGSDPLAAPSDADPLAPSSQAVMTQGRCVEQSPVSCSNSSSACAAGAFCFVEGTATTGACVRDTGASCTPDRPVATQGCLAGATCVRDFVVLGIADRDGDQVPDGIDNCPEKANTDQADSDHDGVGDACDLQTCGNGVVQLAEQCDDGNLVDGDGCDSNCRVTRCGNGIKTAGEACDDGNLIAGDGCSPACLVGPVLGDADGDLVPNSLDNCPYKPNAAQTDSGGINTAVPDGIGDACQCGDTNNDGKVTSTDATVLKRALAGLSPAFSVAGLGVGLGKCNVAATATPGVAGCTATDATEISRALAGLSPGILQGCDAAQP